MGDLPHGHSGNQEARDPGFFCVVASLVSSSYPLSQWLGRVLYGTVLRARPGGGIHYFCPHSIGHYPAISLT